MARPAARGALACYDKEAPTYDAYGYPIQTQQQWVARAAVRLPGRQHDRGCALRDRQVLHDGGRGRAPRRLRRPVGGDADSGRARGTAIALHQVRLQELDYFGEFDAILTIDAMENVPPRTGH